VKAQVLAVALVGFLQVAVVPAVVLAVQVLRRMYSPMKNQYHLMGLMSM